MSWRRSSLLTWRTTASSARSIMKLDTYHSGTRSFFRTERFDGIAFFPRRSLLNSFIRALALSLRSSWKFTSPLGEWHHALNRQPLPYRCLVLRRLLHRRRLVDCRLVGRKNLTILESFTRNFRCLELQRPRRLNLRKRAHGLQHIVRQFAVDLDQRHRICTRRFATHMEGRD